MAHFFVTHAATAGEIEVDFYSGDMDDDKNITTDALVKSAEKQKTGTDVFKALESAESPPLAG